MSVGEWVALAWIVGLCGAAAWLIVYGSPRRYAEPTMAWHLFWSAVSAALTWGGLLLAQVSLWPLLVAEWGGVVIMYWRLGLLVASRRRPRDEGDGE